MYQQKNKTATYRIITDEDGRRRYRFFCDISGAVGCTTKPQGGKASEQELMSAWESEGRECFNHCHKCGKWVSDVMYNADVLECVFCAPWEDKPKYCPHCGEAVSGEENKCKRCGSHLRYQGVLEK